MAGLLSKPQRQHKAQRFRDRTCDSASAWDGMLRSPSACFMTFLEYRQRAHCSSEPAVATYGGADIHIANAAWHLPDTGRVQHHKRWHLCAFPAASFLLHLCKQAQSCSLTRHRQSQCTKNSCAAYTDSLSKNSPCTLACP